MESIRTFWKRIYEARYFITLQVRIDLKNKFRRSRLGILWVCVTPLCLTIIMSFVFGVAFQQDIVTYAPYILSGILCWDVFSVSWIAGANTLIGSTPYMQQFNHPVVIYPLKVALVEIVSFLISMIALCIWVLFLNPLHTALGIVLLLPAAIIFFTFSWASVIISSYIGVKYRDYPQIATLLLQVLWYLSPVFFQESMFENSVYLHGLFLINPVTHMLSLIRQPFLYGRPPTLLNYGISLAFAGGVLMIAFLANKKMSHDIIFYL